MHIFNTPMYDHPAEGQEDPQRFSRKDFCFRFVSIQRVRLQLLECAEG